MKISMAIDKCEYFNSIIDYYHYINQIVCKLLN